MSYILTTEEKAEMMRMFKAGFKNTQIADKTGRSEQTISIFLRKNGMRRNKKVKAAPRHMENAANRYSGIPDYLV